MLSVQIIQPTLTKKKYTYRPTYLYTLYVEYLLTDLSYYEDNQVRRITNHIEKVYEHFVVCCDEIYPDIYVINALECFGYPSVLILIRY